jgi:synaptobrevin family protein YKT6
MTQVCSILVYNCNKTNEQGLSQKDSELQHNSLPIQISEVYDLSEYGFLARGTIKEYLKFASRNMASRVMPGKYQNVRYQPDGLDQTFNAYCSTSSDGISVVIITTDTYNLRVAHDLISKVLEKVNTDIVNPNADTNVNYGLSTLLQNYQTPEKVDNITRIEKDLDATKVILADGIGNLLTRGEKLEDLVQKSEDLSFASKAFHKKSRELNRCCIII